MAPMLEMLANDKNKIKSEQPMGRRSREERSSPTRSMGGVMRSVGGPIPHVPRVVRERSEAWR